MKKRNELELDLNGMKMTVKITDIKTIEHDDVQVVKVKGVALSLTGNTLEWIKKAMHGEPRKPKEATA